MSCQFVSSLTAGHLPSKTYKTCSNHIILTPFFMNNHTLRIMLQKIRKLQNSKYNKQQQNWRNEVKNCICHVVLLYVQKHRHLKPKFHSKYKVHQKILFYFEALTWSCNVLKHGMKQNLRIWKLQTHSFC